MDRKTLLTYPDLTKHLKFIAMLTSSTSDRSSARKENQSFSLAKNVLMLRRVKQ